MMNNVGPFATIKMTYLFFYDILVLHSFCVTMKRAKSFDCSAFSFMDFKVKTWREIDLKAAQVLASHVVNGINRITFFFQLFYKANRTMSKMSLWYLNYFYYDRNLCMKRMNSIHLITQWIYRQLCMSEVWAWSSRHEHWASIATFTSKWIIFICCGNVE